MRAIVGQCAPGHSVKEAFEADRFEGFSYPLQGVTTTVDHMP